MMKVTVVFLLIAAIFAVNIEQQQSLLEISSSKIDSISTSDMGKFIMNLAEMHAELRGPLEDLIATIHALTEEITGELAVLDANYQRRANENQRIVLQLSQDIGQADIDIANTRDFIDNVLLPGRVLAILFLFFNRINSPKSWDNSIRTSRKTEKILKRKPSKDRKLFNSSMTKVSEQFSKIIQVKEHQLAISAVDEALQLTAGLLNGNVAFAETKHMEKSIQLIQKRLEQKSEFTPMIEALINLSQNYSDQSQVQQIRKMLDDLRNNVVDSMNKETADEKERESAWEERKGSLNADYAEFQRQVNEATYQITTYNSKIKDSDAFVTQRKSDLLQFQGQLVLQDNENSVFAEETNIYNELRQQYLSDINVSNQARDSFLDSADFSNYIHSRLNNQPLVG